jgi:hypothetical protein
MRRYLVCEAQAALNESRACGRSRFRACVRLFSKSRSVTVVLFKKLQIQLSNRGAMRACFAVLMALFCVQASDSVVGANSAEPPSILIIVPHAPKGLHITIGVNGVEAGRSDRGIESYFTFYSRDLTYGGNYILTVVTPEETFQIATPEPLDTYNNVFSLNLNNHSLTRGKTLSRFLELFAIRLAATLLIEGLVFLAFGYRKRVSWLVFLTVNVLTQLMLNAILLPSSPMNSYIVFRLVGAEFLVFFVELVAFLILIGEHPRWRTLLYVLSSNFASLLLGGWLITVLPF